MAEDKMNLHSDVVERRIIAALETAPHADIPARFAARVAGKLPPRSTVVLTPARYGLRAAVACLVVLIVLMLAFAHLATGSSLFWFSIESIFCAQFALLAVWLVARSHRSTSSF